MSGNDPTTKSFADEPAEPGRFTEGFTFDLDRALAAVDAAPTPAPAPRPAPAPAAPPAGLPQRTPAVEAPILSALPQRTPGSSPAEAPAAPQRASARGSSTSTVPPGRRSLFDDAREGEHLAELTRIPTLAELKLPDVAPAPPPEAREMTFSVEQANPIEIRQFRTAQARRAKQNRQGRVFGRMMLALVLLGGAIAGALTVGRTWVFPTEWDEPLEPLVAQLEASRGPGFARVVPLVEQSASDYAATLATVQIEARYAEQLPVWRALGLAAGAADDPAVATLIGRAYTAVYDPAADQIARRAGATDGLALPVALAGAFAHHRTELAAEAAANGDDDDDGASAAPSVAGVDALGNVPIEDLVGVLLPVPGPDGALEFTSDGPAVYVTQNGAAPRGPAAGVAEALEILPDSDGVVQAEVVDPQADPDDPAEPAAEALDVSGLPLPLAYQLTAPTRLATELAAASSVDLAVGLGDGLRLAAAPVLGEGDAAVGPATSLGIDDWTLIWANRLPGDLVDRLIAGTVADALVTFERGATQCVAASFESANEMYAAAAVGDLTQWAQAGPAAAQATVTAVTPLVTQLVTCDPGAEAAQPNPAAIDALVARQIVRVVPAAPESSEPGTETEPAEPTEP